MNQASKEHILRNISQDVRYDGRTKTQYRHIEITTDVSHTAEGSAQIRIGDTVVIAGVKLALEKPYPDTPNKGNLMVNAELLPIASDKFEMGPPSMDSIELARVVDRTVRESGAIDLQALCVTHGEQVWSVMCDVCPLNNAGNLFDAASLAVAVALQQAVFPAITEDGVDYKTKTKNKLPLSDVPLSVTVWKIGDEFIVDPTEAEQEAFDARLTVGMLSDGHICALQKGGDGVLSVDDAKTMVGIAQDAAKHLRSLL
ncbi:MAG: RNA-binding protein [Candidatus Woesearchaeota archaeon]